MKWDWDIDAVQLRKELNRERNALKASQSHNAIRVRSC